MATSINQEVWRLLQSDLAIQKDIARKIVNNRALAKYLIKKYHMHASLDSVISAIRRFQTEDSFHTEEKKLRKVFKNSIISTKNNVACITVDIDAKNVYEKVCNMLNGNRFKIISATHQSKIIVDQPKLDEFKGIFNKNVSNITMDLAEIRLTVDEEALQTKGVMARLSNEISLANINIEELIVCPPEFLIYIKERDLVNAHQSILKLCEEFIG